MQRTVIIDDEPNARQVIANILDLYCKEVEVVGQAENVKSGIELIQKQKPDLVLLDIQMPDGSGFDLLKKIEKIDFNFIFITAHEQYAIKAIKLSALDYVLKPINANELIDAIEKAELNPYNHNDAVSKLDNYHANLKSANPDKRISINTTDSVYSIKIKEITYCMSDKNYTELHMKDNSKLLISKTLKDFEILLSEYGFFRVHQSYLVNMRYVTRFAKLGLGGNVILDDGTKIPVSSRKRDGFLRYMENM
ncbi:MAG: DNA-binding response regulator [Marinilabiliales bacterium]|nr:MAG: DNA-binding response regulator [Marinilabiliales bacterium]